MKISIAELRRKLPVGSEFTLTCFSQDAYPCPPGMEITRRKVLYQTAASMTTEFLDGPKTGERIYLRWEGLQANQDGDSILITLKGDAAPFLKITLPVEVTS